MPDISANGDRRQVLELALPLKVTSRTNAREHWRDSWRQSKIQRRAAYLGVLALLRQRGPMALQRPVSVELTREGPRLLDSDNLAEAFKSVRDGIADALQGQYLKGDDRDALIHWAYVGEAGHRAYGVRIVITEAGEGRA